MMTMPHLFQSFDLSEPAGDADETELSEGIEELRLQAFENGYKAGWEDAVKAQADTQGAVSADLASNLQDVSFTYHEVRTALTASVQDLVVPIVENLLPVIAHASLGAHIVERIRTLTRSQLERKIEVVVSPLNTELVEKLLSGNVPEPFVIAADASLGDSQVFLRIGEQEEEIDLGRVISEISSSVLAHFHSTSEDMTDE